MKCRILHESKQRIRVRAVQFRMSFDEADIWEAYLRLIPGVTDVSVFDRTGDAVIRYTCCRERVIDALACFSYEENSWLLPDHSTRALNREYEDKLFYAVARRLISRLFLPVPVRLAIAWFRALGYLKKAAVSLSAGRLEVSVLDAAAITTSLLRGDLETASSVIFLQGIGTILEEWTHKKSVSDLASVMSLNIDRVWVRSGESEELVPVSLVKEGDRIVVRTGSMVPLDGTVCEGEAMVSQASITGEPLPVEKKPGSYVYAGTVVEEGECCILVDKASGSGRYDRIVRMIEQSEKMKSESEDKAAHLADRMVPWSFAGTALTYLLTRNPARALSFLMVDFSCALKLTMPLAVLSAMKEAGRHHISVKGGKFLEAVASADTIIFDKTGTLTHAAPRIAGVVPFGNTEEKEALRLAACLEEHYPHSIARAVVEEARQQGLSHEERHSTVEYVVAHGISSRIDGNHVVIGSQHFVFEDEGCRVPPGEEKKFDDLPDEYSHLYLAVSGELSAVILIEDPIREEAADVISGLKALGLRNCVMMTGDSERTAKAVAEKVGITEYYSEVLPEDKAAYIRKRREAGHSVIMIGDGVNDSPALSEADAGIAISAGAAIAREIADITIQTEDLNALLSLRQTAAALMSRIHGNYRKIIGFNAALITLGAAGILSPGISSLLHNTSTIAFSIQSMTRLLPDGKQAGLPVFDGQ